MTVATSIIDGVFGVIKALIGLLGTLLLLSFLMRMMDSAFTRGKQRGQLGIMNPRRLFCKHRVSHYTAGEHGLWAMWCADCGAKVNRK